MGRPAPMQRSCDERDHVQGCVRRGKANARTLTRARVLLKSDEGWTDAEIAEALDISEQTIRNCRLTVICRKNEKLFGQTTLTS